MPELSLNILDVAQNSIRAGASIVELSVIVDTALDRLSITIADDGCGMSSQQVQNVIDPFFTTRTTRKVGLGIPFFKFAAEAAGGEFSIESTLSVGTTVRADFMLSNIDRMPLGDITATVHMLVTFNTDIEFVYKYKVDEREFTLDTREFKEVLDGAPLNSPEVSLYIKEYLVENKSEVDGGIIF